MTTAFESAVPFSLYLEMQTGKKMKMQLQNINLEMAFALQK